jgi:hypothetical protein
MKNFFLPLTFFVMFLVCGVAFADENKMSIDPGFGSGANTVYTFVNLNYSGQVTYDGPHDLGSVWTYDDISAAVDKYSVVEHMSGYPDVLYIEPYFYFVYYDKKDQNNILNIFVINESFFYTTIPDKILY